MSTNKQTILYAEDDADDVQLVNECFANYKDSIEIVHAPNGQEALELLNTLHAKGITPCLIILDINMPVMDGKQVLVKLKNTPAYKDIPTVIFTTSSNKMDIAFATNWGADFITKPLKFDEINTLAHEFSKRCKG
ncbi:MAG TPA: response regulator [Chitinophagaceae bacterium]|jgi:CheY-like chemotaxis protein|nr:response regulator [Chitinophagaceae bacterium]